jgi:phosphopantetheinyl transferase
LRRDAHGRPRLDGALRAFDVSWSHSGEGLLIALGEGVDVGADLERARLRRARWNWRSVSSTPTNTPGCATCPSPTATKPSSACGAPRRRW